MYMSTGQGHTRETILLSGGIPMKVHVNANCISCGLCVSTCPNVFLITDGGTAGVYSEEVPPELEDQVQAAADACPVSAIEAG